MSTVLSNGFLPLIPILIWNLLLTKKLPPSHDPEIFDKDIPKIILHFENGFRFLVFLIPLFIKLNIRSDQGQMGLIIFSIGTLIYFASWLLLIHFPESKWSTGLPGFAAPAWTPLIWLTGLSLLGKSFYFNWEYTPCYLLIPSILFLILHSLHAGLTWRREFS